MIIAPQRLERLRQLRKLTEVSRAITYAASLDEIFGLTVDRACELIGAEKVLLMVANDQRLLKVRAARGVEARLAKDFLEPLNETLIPRLNSLLDAQPENFVGVPLVVNGVIQGILVVIRSSPSSTHEQDEWLLSALADQAALALERQHLDKIGEFREQLIGIASHDLRTPLNTILMAAQLLVQQQGLDERATELARRITRSATRATRLVEQLLDLTRSRLGGGIPIEPTLFDLSEVCVQVVSEIELKHPDRPLRVSLRGNLKGSWDRDRLSQVLSNLIGNAVQHGEPRTAIELRVTGSEDGVVIEVQNSGPPIPEAMLPVMFEAFRQGRHSSRSHGLGLGLFIVQQIIHAHGGSIVVSSAENQGTTFRAFLPRKGRSETQ